MSDEREKVTYIARDPKCGHIVAAAVVATGDTKRWENQVAKDVAEWVRDGLTVSSGTAAMVRSEGLCLCRHTEASR